MKDSLNLFAKRKLGGVEEVPMAMQQHENGEGKEDAEAQSSSQRLDFTFIRWT